MTVEERLAQKGFSVPDLALPVGEYVPAKQVGDLVYVSGQGPILCGKALCCGQVGGLVSIEQASRAAQVCVLNALAAVKWVVGSLERVVEVVHVRGFVSSAPGFVCQPKVMDGASELLIHAFGERGRHARASLGTSILPDDIPVEVEIVVRIG